MLTINGNDLKLTRGDSASLSLQLKDVAGDQIDLVTGDTVYFTIKTSPAVTEKTLQKTITAFDAGIANIEIAPEDTASLSCGTYWYDVQYNNVAGEVKTIIPPSRFEVAPEVTYE